MEKVTQNTEFIIGINFGSSETSAAFYDLRNHDKCDLDILPGIKVIKSAVAELEKEGKVTICVGDAAIQNAPYSKNFQIGFRKRPSEMNLSERNRMVAFMHGVYISILKLHPAFASRSHVIYIAGPSSDLVFEKEEKEYLKMAENAGLPVAGIIKRYCAAIFRAATQPNSKIGRQNGTLLVDYGANTIDFAYFNGSLSKPIYYGSPLGASAIERILLKYAMENPSDAYMSDFAKLYGNDEDSAPYQGLLYKFRLEKETFYRNEHKGFKLFLDYVDLTLSGSTQIEGLGRIVIPKEKIDEILGLNNRDGYIGQIKEYVRFFKNNILVDNKVEGVYLIGGASRMDFVRRIFMEVFNLDASHCVIDDNPSVIISQGVVRLAYARYANETNPYYSQYLNTLYEYARD